jgi:arsenate reductase-like glutaredoxin family protein
MPPSVSWYYHRTSCDTCARSQAFLAARGVAIGEQVSANKVKYGRAEALAMARGAREVIALRGRSVQRFALADRPTDDGLAAVLLGRAETLRAPALRVGDRLVIGFGDEVFAELFR